MKEKEIGEIIMKAIEKMVENEKDESWKAEAILALDERIAAFNKIVYKSFTQYPELN